MRTSITRVAPAILLAMACQGANAWGVDISDALATRGSETDSSADAINAAELVGLKHGGTLTVQAVRYSDGLAIGGELPGTAPQRELLTHAADGVGQVVVHFAVNRARTARHTAGAPSELTGDVQIKGLDAVLADVMHRLQGVDGALAKAGNAKGTVDTPQRDTSFVATFAQTYGRAVQAVKQDAIEVKDMTFTPARGWRHAGQTVIDLGHLGGLNTIAEAINTDSTISELSDDAPDDAATVVYAPGSNQALRNLGMLAAGSTKLAMSIDENGTITGTATIDVAGLVQRTFEAVGNDEKPVELSAPLGAGAGWATKESSGGGDSGSFVQFSSFAGVTNGFFSSGVAPKQLMLAVPEPGAVGLCLGLGAILIRRRRAHA